MALKVYQLKAETLTTPYGPQQTIALLQAAVQTMGMRLGDIEIHAVEEPCDRSQSSSSS